MLIIFGTYNIQAQEVDNLDGYTDMPYATDKKIKQDIYYQTPKDINTIIEIKGYFFKKSNDSLLMFRIQSPQNIQKGTSSLTINYSDSKNDYYLQHEFAAILKDKDLTFPGSYKIYLTISNNENGKKIIFEQTILRDVDSNINFTSRLGKGLAELLSKTEITVSKNPATQQRATDALLKKSENYFKKKGLTQVIYQVGDKKVVELFTNGWFVGRYETDPNSLKKNIDEAKDFLNGTVNRFASNQLDNYESLMTQIKKMKKEVKDNNQLSGVFAISTNYSSDQEEYSEQDNFYYDLSGAIDLPLFGIPVSVEGFYTSQDKDRKVKASYVRFHYDVDKAKEQLMKLISGYNQRLEETIAKGKSYDDVYEHAIKQLGDEKNKSIAMLSKQLGVIDIDISKIDENYIKEKAIDYGQQQKQSILDSLNYKIQHNKKVKTVQEKGRKSYQDALDTYKKIMELEQQISQYKKQLEQYKQVLKYDTLIAGNKVKELDDLDKMSYKDMAKAASDLLPEGKIKKLTTGLTNFDAGIFSNRVSEYTMSGQILKGVDAGYDLGFSTIGASYGIVEYAGRDGTLDRYSSYSGRVGMKPIFKQQVSFVYFGYTPSKAFLGKDEFFKDADVSLPSFRNPVHIMSAKYNGAISKSITMEGEFAFSSKQGQSPEAAAFIPFKDRTSYYFSVDGQIPQTNLMVNGRYEHVGTDFENNTLPFILSGTKRYSVAVKGLFFKSFLLIGVDYSLLKQNNLSGKSQNAKWGFDISTHSKRYPTILISYKPFSTFRSFDDTLNVAQKPISGEVWIGRLSYQKKINNNIFRVMFLYNKNSSTSDTIAYASTSGQLSLSYTIDKKMLSLNAGTTNVSTTMDVTYPLFNNSQFLNMAAGTPLSKQLYLNLGTDIAKNKNGICRYGLFSGVNYNFKKMPLSVRANFRYNTYKLTENELWKPIYSGGLEVAWRFKFKLYDHF